MKKFFKTALLTMLFTTCLGATALAEGQTSVSGGDSGDSSQGSVSVSGGDVKIEAEVDGAVNIVLSAPSNENKQAAENQVTTAVEQATKDATGVAYETVEGAEVISVEIDLAQGQSMPEGGVKVTLKNDAYAVGKTFLIMHNHEGVWDYQAWTVKTAGQVEASFNNFSTVSTVEVKVVEVPVETPDEKPGTDEPSYDDFDWDAYYQELAYWAAYWRGKSFDRDLDSMIGGTPVGGVIRVTKDDCRSSLTLDMVKKIVSRDLTLVMEYTYNGADYRIVIPGKKAVIDETVPIYGPLYLAAHYSSSAAVGGSANGVTYIIAKGDTLSRIAAANGTTVAVLAALNPQIKDVNVIYAGQSIKLK